MRDDVRASPRGPTAHARGLAPTPELRARAARSYAGRRGFRLDSRRAAKPYFPDIGESVLADCIATYQQLGCWTPHVEITHAAYEKTLDVFEYVGLLKRRYRYEQVCAEPPATD